MSFVIPDLHGPAHGWLMHVNPATVTEGQFRSALDNFIEHSIAQGIDADQFMDPDTYFQVGDLQLYENVRSSWSPVPKARLCPTLASMLLGIRTIGTPRTFRQNLELQYAQFRAWCVQAKLDPDNLNETKDERERRLSRERMRRKRGRDALADVSDPEEMALIRALRVAKENAKSGHAWFKGVEIAAKQAYDAAVDSAKLARTHTVSDARLHIMFADQAVGDCEQALVEYRANK